MELSPARRTRGGAGVISTRGRVGVGSEASNSFKEILFFLLIKLPALVQQNLQVVVTSLGVSVLICRLFNGCSLRCVFIVTIITLFLRIASWRTIAKVIASLSFINICLARNRFTAAGVASFGTFLLTLIFIGYVTRRLFGYVFRR